MKILKIEEEKGSMWTSFGHGLAGSKEEGNSLRILASNAKVFRKGKELLFSCQKRVNSGNII